MSAFFWPREGQDCSSCDAFFEKAILLLRRSISLLMMTGAFALVLLGFIFILRLVLWVIG